jgi:hypothetical protein
MPGIRAQILVAENRIIGIKAQLDYDLNIPGGKGDRYRQ